MIDDFERLTYQTAYEGLMHPYKNNLLQFPMEELHEEKGQRHVQELSR